jgi:acetyl-CoA carboxylase biotin carboxyl carrier protein
MNIKEVKDLIHEVLHSDISEFELEHTGTKVRLKRGLNSTGSSTAATVHHSSEPAHAVHIEASSGTPAPDDAVREEELHLITSPIVGTFYRSPSPGVEPYVRIGDSIEEGAILCVVEAMKLMNEIPSDAPGEVVRIFVENGNPVEFGQKLFGILLHK